MAIPIWRIRPSPSRIRFFGFLVLFLVFTSIYYLFPAGSFEARASWSGPQVNKSQNDHENNDFNYRQSDTSKYFQLDNRKAFVPKNDPILSNEELRLIRDRLFSDDQVRKFNHDAYPAVTTALLIQVHNRPQFFKGKISRRL